MCKNTLKFRYRLNKPVLFLPNRFASVGDLSLLQNDTQTKNPMRLPPPQQALLPPRLPLLLPRRLAIPKRKPARPLVRARSLAHPRCIRPKQQRPSSETEQRSVPNKARRESESPPRAHDLRVQVESRNGLESHRDRSRRFADFVLGRDAGAAGRG